MSNTLASKVADWRKKRNKTISLLNKLADELDEMQDLVDSAAIGSQMGSILSSICVISASFTGGLTLAAGTAAGVCGGVIAGGSLIGKHFHEKDLMERIQDALEKDKWDTTRINEHVSKIKVVDILKGARTLAGCTQTFSELTAKYFATGSRKTMVKDVAKTAERVGYTLNVVLLPVDIVCFVNTCIKKENGSKHEVSKQIRNIACELEEDMYRFLQCYDQEQSKNIPFSFLTTAFFMFTAFMVYFLL